MHHLVCIIGVYKPEEICKLGSFQAELTHRNGNKRKGNWVGAAGEISDSVFGGFAKTPKEDFGSSGPGSPGELGADPIRLRRLAVYSPRSLSKVQGLHGVESKENNMGGGGAAQGSVERRVCSVQFLPSKSGVGVGVGGDRRVRPGRVNSAQSAIKCLEGSVPRALIY